jgi:hypothetical protein
MSCAVLAMVKVVILRDCSALHFSSKVLCRASPGCNAQPPSLIPAPRLTYEFPLVLVDVIHLPSLPRGKCSQKFDMNFILSQKKNPLVPNQNAFLTHKKFPQG